MVALRLLLLGGFEARLGAGDAVSLPTKKAQGLLAYLALQPGHAHQRAKLAALLWGTHSDERARDGLRHALVALRKALHGIMPPPLIAEAQTLALDAAVVTVDAVTFQRHVAEGTPRALERAADLYRGDLLLGFTASEPLFEEWLAAERERLREMALEAHARLLAHQAKVGRTEPAIRTALRLLALDPLQEAVHRTLMRLYTRQGRRGAALKQYQLCVTALNREVGTDPEAETRQLYQEILRREPLHELPASDATSPPPRHDVDTNGSQAPADTRLTGRAPELARLREALDRADNAHGQLVAVVGGAGIGKTALLGAIAADAVAREARILLGRCYESASILPFGPWVDAFRGGRVLDDDTAIAALGPVWQSELARLLPELARPGLPMPSDNPLRLFESVAHLIGRLATRQLVVVMLEDVHWADDMSLRLFAFIARCSRRWRVLLLTTAREEALTDASVARHTLAEVGRTPHAAMLKLAPLSPPDIALRAGSLPRVGDDVDALARLEEQVGRSARGIASPSWTPPGPFGES